MIDRNIGVTRRVFVLADHRQGSTCRFGRVFFLSVGVDRPPYDLGNRDPQRPGTAPQPPVLFSLQLYLDTHHDGMRIPSSGRRTIGPAGHRRVATKISDDPMIRCPDVPMSFGATLDGPAEIRRPLRTRV